MNSGTSPAAKAAKQKWNSANYTQIKISVAPIVAAAFKKACTAQRKSIAGVLTDFMKEYAAEPDARQIGAPVAANTIVSPPKSRTLRGRRTVMSKICREISELIGGEEAFIQNVPENLQNSANYTAAEERVASLEEALELLSEIYS